MLRLFRNLKIAEKLLLTELAMTLSMLLVFSIFALGNHYHNLRTHMAEGVLLQMNVVTTSIGPAVMFGDHDDDRVGESRQPLLCSKAIGKCFIFFLLPGLVGAASPSGFPPLLCVDQWQEMEGAVLGYIASPINPQISGAYYN